MRLLLSGCRALPRLAGTAALVFALTAPAAAQSSGGLFDGLFPFFGGKKAAPGRVDPRTGVILKSGPPPGAAAGSRPAPSPGAPSTSGGSGAKRSWSTHRTVCVRLCDGYFWPIGDETRSSDLGRDREACESSCSTPARLYILTDLARGADSLHDLNGKPYSKLPTAFLYRKELVPDCRCRPDPWSAAEAERHRQYALAQPEEAATGESGYPALASYAIGADETPPTLVTISAPGGSGYSEADLTPGLPPKPVLRLRAKSLGALTGKPVHSFGELHIPHR